jgi:hypothetical protein
VTTAVRVTCEGQIGVESTPWGLEPVRCGQSVGVRRWHDMAGHEHAACVRHIAVVEHRYPEAPPLTIHETLHRETSDPECSDCLPESELRAIWGDR